VGIKQFLHQEGAMQDERIPEEGEGRKRLNEDDEVEAHRQSLADDASRHTKTEDDDEVEAHRMARLGQTEDPGFKR
jgi:hypothetical protein